jgi:hypothetical protein
MDDHDASARLSGLIGTLRAGLEAGAMLHGGATTRPCRLIDACLGRRWEAR